MTRPELVENLAARIGRLKRDHPVRVAIDGVDAAGKTTLADELATALGASGRQIIRASIDGFHNPASVRKRRGPLSSEGYFHDSFDLTALRESLLNPLGTGGSRIFTRVVFDFRTDQAVRAPVEHASEDSILVVDGVFLLRDELRDGFDYSVFVRAGFDVTVARAEVRDLDLFGSVENIRRRYAERYVPGQRLYLETVKPESRASVVIDNNDPLRPEVVPDYFFRPIGT
jgi:uridine kinase